MQVKPYLNFDGRCEEAFRFYEKHLGAKIDAIFRFAGSPMESQIPAAARNQVMHASMTIGDTNVMGADAPGEHYQKPQGFSVSINLTDAAEAERIFAAMSEKGTVQMPLQQTFWATRFGMLVDQFGIPWMINCSPAQ